MIWGDSALFFVHKIFNFEGIQFTSVRVMREKTIFTVCETFKSIKLLHTNV